MRFSRTGQSGEPPREADHGRNSLLSPREREIAHLVATGLTNREIAEHLIISTRTVESHVDHIKVKLGFVRRARIVAWVLDPATDDGARSASNHCSNPLPNSA